MDVNDHDDSNTYLIRASKWINERKRVKLIAMMQFFLLGAEFSLITPTLPFYLGELHASSIPIFSGLVLASYFAAGIVSTLILGRIVDMTLRFRRTVTLINALTVAGNALYIVGYSPYIIILARFLSGVVEAIYPIVYSELARCYTVEEFPRHGAHLMTAFSLGFSVSPGLNMLPKDTVLNFGFTSIRYTNAPGAILFGMYFIQFLVAAIGLTNPSLDKQRNKLDVYCMKDVELKNINVLTSSSENEDQSLLKENPDKRSDYNEKIAVSESPWWIILRQLITREEILILLYGNMIWAYFAVSGMTLLPLTAIRYLQFNHQQVSALYIGFGIIIALALYLNSRLISKYGPVKTCIAAFLISFISLSFLYLTVLSERLSIDIRAFIFVVHGTCFFLGWFLNSVAMRATVSKHVPMVDQSFCLGIFAMVEQVFCFIASSSGGFAFSVIELYCCWSIALNLGALFMFVSNYEKLERNFNLSGSED